MPYSDKILDHYNNPRNVGSFDAGDPTVGTGLVGAPECGDVMKLQIKVNPATGRDRGRQVQDVRLRLARSRPAAWRPSGSRARRSTRRWRSRTPPIVEELALPPVKVHCSVLAEDAIKAAIKNYQEKQDAAEPAEAGRRRLAGRVRSRTVAVSIHRHRYRRRSDMSTVDRTRPPWA